MDAILAQALAGTTLGRPDGSLVIGDWSIDAPGDGETLWMAPVHRHHHDDEAWYVLQGRLTVRLGEQTVTAPSGGAILAPAGTPHSFANPGPGPCRYLIVMTPRIAALIDALHALPDDLVGEARMARVAAVFAEHDSELLVGLN